MTINDDMDAVQALLTAKKNAGNNRRYFAPVNRCWFARAALVLLAIAVSLLGVADAYIRVDWRADVMFAGGAILTHYLVQNYLLANVSSPSLFSRIIVAFTTLAFMFVVRASPLNDSFDANVAHFYTKILVLGIILHEIDACVCTRTTSNYKDRLRRLDKDIAAFETKYASVRSPNQQWFHQEMKKAVMDKIFPSTKE